MARTAGGSRNCAALQKEHRRSCLMFAMSTSRSRLIQDFLHVSLLQSPASDIIAVWPGRACIPQHMSHKGKPTPTPWCSGPPCCFRLSARPLSRLPSCATRLARGYIWPLIQQCDSRTSTTPTHLVMGSDVEVYGTRNDPTISPWVNRPLPVKRDMPKPE